MTTAIWPRPGQSVRPTGTSVVPVLSAEEVRRILNSIDTSTPIGLCDRALIGTMVYTFARVGAVVQMQVDDYYSIGNPP